MKLLGDMHTKIHNRLKTKKSVQSYSARYLPASYSVYIYIYNIYIYIYIGKVCGLLMTHLPAVTTTAPKNVQSGSPSN